MTNPLLARFLGVPALLAPHLRERFEAALQAVANDERGAELTFLKRHEAVNGGSRRSGTGTIDSNHQRGRRVVASLQHTGPVKTATL